MPIIDGRFALGYGPSVPLEPSQLIAIDAAQHPRGKQALQETADTADRLPRGFNPRKGAISCGRDREGRDHVAADDTFANDARGRFLDTRAWRQSLSLRFVRLRLTIWMCTLVSLDHG